MCGLAAIFAYNEASSNVDLAELRRIRDRMTARGPDGAGEWIEEESRVGLGHRRLTIIDLSDRAAQPMVSSCGHYVISFNGEIYNYQVLRDELVREGFCPRTSSDTEVLLELYARRGLATFRMLRGMFAFAIWDRQERILLLGRDPYGIKPLYYADDGRTLRAASQVKALRTSDRVSNDPEPAGIVGFFLFGSVPEPYTCWREIRAVPAGCVVRVDSLGPHEPTAYHTISTAWRDGDARNAAEDPQPTIAMAVRDAVRHHLVADVPVGLFLSAGVDSGVLLGHMAELRGPGDPPLRTITLAFDEYGASHDDEAPLAEQVATHYGAAHHTRRVGEAEFQADLPAILGAMDQPTIDGLNSWFVSKAARELGLKVALSGLGGDELFGGYALFREMPRCVRLCTVPSRLPLAGYLFRQLVTVSSRWWPGTHPKFAGLLELGGSYPGAYLLFRGLFMPWELTTVLSEDVAFDGLQRLAWRCHVGSCLEGAPRSVFGRVALLQACLYMRNQLLRDADWASMAHSLEVRVPLVDVVLLETLAPFLTGLGRGATPKEALAKSLAEPLPEAVTTRAKTGFSVPTRHWLEKLTAPTSARLGPGEPWARQWARLVAARALPAYVLARPLQSGYHLT